MCLSCVCQDKHTCTHRSGSGGKAAAEERKRLQAELGVAVAGRAAQEAAARALEAQLAEHHQQATQEAATAADVLASQQRQQLAAEEASRAREQQLAGAQSEATALRKGLEEVQASATHASAGTAGGAAAEQENSELLRLLADSRRQEERLEAAVGALEALRLRLGALERELAAERDAVATMQAGGAGRRRPCWWSAGEQREPQASLRWAVMRRNPCLAAPAGSGARPQ